jgi:hypothetical protein
MNKSTFFTGQPIFSQLLKPTEAEFEDSKNSGGNGYGCTK